MQNTLLFLLIFPTSAHALCLEHEVKTGDTLAAISEEYLGDAQAWEKIAKQNSVNKKIVVGDTLYIHVEDHHDWKVECDYIISDFLKKQRIEADRFIPSIVLGIEAAEKYTTFSPEEKLFLCKAAITTVKKESNFKYVMGRAGEIGYYQFLPKTIIGVFKKYGIKIKTDTKFLRTIMRDETLATFLFALHFSSLKEKHGTFGAWYKYNGTGKMAQIYARNVYRLYRKVDATPNFCCKPKLD